MMLSTEFTPDARFTVDGWRGIAFYFNGWEMEDDEDTEWSGIQIETGRILAVMVGDDREHSVDPDDCTLLNDDDYCSECGQVGCTANAFN